MTGGGFDGADRQPGISRRSRGGPDKGRSARSRRLRMPRSTRRRSHGPSTALGPTKIQLSPKRLELLALRELDQRRRGACFVFTCGCSDDEGASSGEISPRVATPERQQPPAPQAAPTHRSLARSSRTRIGRGRLKTDNAFALRNLGGHRGGTLRPFWRCVHTSHRWEHSSLSRSAAGCWSAAGGPRRRDGRALKTVPAQVTGSSARTLSNPARLRGAHFAAVYCSRQTVQLQADSASCSLLRPVRLDF